MRQTGFRLVPHDHALAGLVVSWLVLVACGTAPSAWAADEAANTPKSPGPANGVIGAAPAQRAAAVSSPPTRPAAGPKTGAQKAALPIPPTPPPTLSPVPYVGVTGFLPAPVPNWEIRRPNERALPPISVAPSTFRLSEGQLGSGYPYGASSLGVAQSRAALVPGVVLKMPLR